MVPLGGKIDLEESKLVLKKAEMEIPMVEEKGGHFVFPVAGIDVNNVKKQLSLNHHTVKVST